jgi:archaellum component FlaC
MDALNSAELFKISTSLTELAVKGTVTAISSKITAIKDEKNVEKIRNTYDEIVNELLNERGEAIRIAQIYKSELERVVISDEDIQHLHNTVSRVLEIFKAIQTVGALSKGKEEVAKVNAQVDSYEQIKELISVDTLKTMQLIGFNYKAAIGEPLTQICANAISSLGDKSKRDSSSQQIRKK